MSRLESRALQSSDNENNGRLKVGQPLLIYYDGWGCVTTPYLFHTCVRHEPVGLVSYQR
jgi:hypothetical protein